MLFILAMDPLQQLLVKATEAGLLTPIGADPVKMRMSLYADDAIMFLRPIAATTTSTLWYGYWTMHQCLEI
jgi:hypothetical protein